MKSDGLLARNWLRGEIGDAIHAVLCGAGHNLRMILAYRKLPHSVVTCQTPSAKRSTMP